MYVYLCIREQCQERARCGRQEFRGEELKGALVPAVPFSLPPRSMFLSQVFSGLRCPVEPPLGSMRPWS